MKLNLKLFYLLFFIILGTTIHAQTSTWESESSTFKNEIGVNVTRFFTNYVNFGGVTLSNNPYQFTYKRIQDNQAFRAGLTAFYRKEDRNSTGPFGQPNTDIFTTSGNVRIGYEWQKPLNKNWMWYYGIDGFGSVDNSRSTSVSNFWNGSMSVPVDAETFFNVHSLGVGPITGIYWNLSDRISIFTEAGFFFTYQEDKRGNTWKDVPQSVKDANQFFDFEASPVSSFNKTLSPRMPLDIFLTIKF